MIKYIVGILLALLWVTHAQAQVGPAAPASADPYNKFLAPFIDGQTVLVAHLDASKVDTAAIQKYILAVMDDAKIPAAGPERNDLAAGMAVFDNMLTRFKQLGGRDVYALVSHADVWPHMQPAAFLVKIDQPGNANLMKEFLTANMRTLHQGTDPTPQEIEGGEFEVVQLRDDVLFVGQDVPLKRLQSLKPEARPELQLVRTDVALEVDAALTPDERRAIHELMPLLPAEVGGGSTDFLTRIPMTVRLLMDLPPKPSITLSFIPRSGQIPQAIGLGAPPSTPDLDAVDFLIDKLRDLLLASPDFADAMNQPEFKPHAAEITAAIKQALEPTNPGTLSLSDDQIKSLLPMVMEGAAKGQEAAMRQTSAAYIHQLLQAAIVYTADHKGMLPESLDVLVKGGQVAPENLIDPMNHRPYVYRAIFPQLVGQSQTIPMIWEQVDGDDAVNVGFADGHVELMAHRSFLDKAIKDAEALKAKQDSEKKPN